MIDLEETSTFLDVTLSKMEKDNRRRFSDSLRQLADIIDENPELKLPYTGVDTEIVFYVLGKSEEFSKNQAAIFSKAIPGIVKKGVEHGTFDLSGKIGTIPVRMSLTRDAVCTRHVTGTETVTTRQLKEALPEDAYHDVTEEREIVEWVCPDSLLGGASND